MVVARDENNACNDIHYRKVIDMRNFLAKLKQQAEEQPIVALGVAAGLLTAGAKTVDSVSAAKSRKAYAKQVQYRVKNKK